MNRRQPCTEQRQDACALPEGLVEKFGKTSRSENDFEQFETIDLVKNPVIHEVD